MFKLLGTNYKPYHQSNQKLEWGTNSRNKNTSRGINPQRHLSGETYYHYYNKKIYRRLKMYKVSGNDKLKQYIYTFHRAYIYIYNK